MPAKLLLVLIAAALLLLGSSCGGGICVGYGCYYYDPCYPFCVYAEFRDWFRGLPFFPRAAAAGDFDGDGVAELIVLDESGALARFAGDGSSGKADEIAPLPLADGPETRRILAGHFDDDGILDLVAVDERTGAIDLLWGSVDGDFVLDPTPRGLGLGGALVDVDCADLDGDGLDDLVVLDADAHLSVLVADGVGGFLASSGGSYALVDSAAPNARVVCAGLDAQPGADAAVVLPDAQVVMLLSGRGDGTFDAPQRLDAQIPESLLDATWCDGRDGRPADLVLLFASPLDEDHRVVRLGLHGEDAGLLAADTTSVGHATRVEAAEFTGDARADLILVDGVAGKVQVLRTMP